MPLGNCAACGKVAFVGARGLCSACLKQEDEDFDRLREFLAREPQLTVEELAERSGLDEGRILRFLREGRLVMSQASSPLRCQRCGEPIPGGRFCPRCLRELEQSLRGPQPQEKSSLHIADRIKRK